MRRSFGFLTKEGFRNIWANRLMSIASIAVLLSCLIMIGSAFMILVNIQQFIDSIEDRNVIMVYVSETADEAATEKLGAELKSLDNVAGCDFVDKETAFKQQLQELGTDATYFEGVENPLPDLYKVRVTDMEKFDDTTKEIEKLQNVESIRDNKDLASTLINPVRITMFSRRLEISIMKSVGATNGFIRWPFVIEGMILGVISAGLSLAAVGGLYEVAKKSIASMLGSVMGIGRTLVPFREYVFVLLAAFLIIGVLSGVVGSMVSIQRYLKEQGGVTYEENE